MTIRYLIACLFISTQILAQKPNSWILPQIGKGLEKINCIESDTEGNIFSCTAFGGRDTSFIYAKNNILQIEPSESNLYYTNMLVTKFDKEGNLLWAVPIEGQETVYAWSSHVSKDGSYYVGGNFKRDAHFYSTEGEEVYIEFQVPQDYPKQFLRFFLVKYNSNGVLQWVRTGHSWDNMTCFDIVSDDEGNAYAWVYTPSNKVTIGDYSIYPSSDTKQYLERYHACLIKYSPDGEEQWITYTGGYIAPRDLWMEDNELVLAASQHGRSGVIKSTSGDEWIIPGPTEHSYEEREFHFDLKTGEYLNHRELFPDVKAANLHKVEANEHGYLASYSARYIMGKGCAIDIKSDTTFSFSYGNQRDPDLYFFQFDQKHSYQWHCYVSGQRREIVQDMIQLANGDIFFGFQAAYESKFVDANGKDILLKSEGPHDLHIVQVNKNGEFIGHRIMGLVGYNSIQHGMHFSTSNGKDLNIASSMTRSTRVMGYPVNVQPKYSDNPNRGGAENALLIHLEPNDRILLELDIETDDILAAIVSFRRGIYRFAEDVKRISSAVQNTAQEKMDSVKAQVHDNRVDRSLSINQVFVYPNPVSRSNPKFSINFDFESDKPIYIQLINSQSKVIFEERLEIGTRTTSIEIPSDSKAGLYFIRVLVGKEMITRKIVLN